MNVTVCKMDVDENRMSLDFSFPKYCGPWTGVDFDEVYKTGERKSVGWRRGVSTVDGTTGDTTTRGGGGSIGMAASLSRELGYLI